MGSIKEVKVVVFLCCFLFLNLTIGQLRPAWRRRAINTPPLVSSLLLQNNQDEVVPMLLKSGKTQSPSYRHKLLQLHGDSNTDSNHGYNHRKHFMNHYLLSKLFPSYPVAAKVVKFDARESGGKNMPVNLDNEEINFWDTIPAVVEPQLSLDDLNYNPYVGAQAFTNMTKFFQHLRENLRAVQSMEQQDNEEKTLDEDVG